MPPAAYTRATLVLQALAAKGRGPGSKVCLLEDIFINIYIYINIVSHMYNMMCIYTCIIHMKPAAVRFKLCPQAPKSAHWQAEDVLGNPELYLSQQPFFQ